MKNERQERMKKLVPRAFLGSTWKLLQNRSLPAGSYALEETHPISSVRIEGVYDQTRGRQLNTSCFFAGSRTKILWFRNYRCQTKISNKNLGSFRTLLAVQQIATSNIIIKHMIFRSTFARSPSKEELLAVLTHKKLPKL